MSTALHYKCDFKMMEEVKKIVYVHLCKCIAQTLIDLFQTFCNSDIYRIDIIHSLLSLDQKGA